MLTENNTGLTECPCTLELLGAEIPLLQPARDWYRLPYLERRWVDPQRSQVCQARCSSSLAQYKPPCSLYVINIRGSNFALAVDPSTWQQLLQVSTLAFRPELAQQPQQPLFSLGEQGGPRACSLRGPGRGMTRKRAGLFEKWLSIKAQLSIANICYSLMIPLMMLCYRT